MSKLESKDQGYIKVKVEDQRSSLYKNQSWRAKVKVISRSQLESKGQRYSNVKV